jgi:hypothetical protein
VFTDPISHIRSATRLRIARLVFNWSQKVLSTSFE